MHLRGEHARELRTLVIGRTAGTQVLRMHAALGVLEQRVASVAGLIDAQRRMVVAVIALCGFAWG